MSDQEVLNGAAEVFDEFSPAPTPPVRKQRRPASKPSMSATTHKDASLALEGIAADRPACVLDDFHAFLPEHKYINVRVGDLWPASSIDGAVEWPLDEVTLKRVKPSAWLDINRPLLQLTWDPRKPALICDQVVQVSGWAPHKGARVFNLYRPPPVTAALGDPAAACRWIDHVTLVYPEESLHIIRWLAYKLQHPGEKINHALVLGGRPGVGKDTILEPVKAGIGAWNWQEITPTQMLGRFNAWAKSIIVRVNEARNLGEVDRFSFYENSKGFIAAPPDVIRVDEKHLREHYIVNVLGLIITSNNKTDGLYLPADDRRHFVAWSTVDTAAFAADYWRDLWDWYGNGGIQHVVAYLRAVDLSEFDPKAPPPKTPAFWAIVQAGEAPESGELREILDAMSASGADISAITLGDLIEHAGFIGLHSLAEELKDRKSRRTIPHRLDRMGYVAVRNSNATDGLWVASGRRQAIYAKAGASVNDQTRAAQRRANR